MKFKVYQRTILYISFVENSKCGTAACAVWIVDCGSDLVIVDVCIRTEACVKGVNVVV